MSDGSLTDRSDTSKRTNSLPHGRDVRALLQHMREHAQVRVSETARHAAEEAVDSLKRVEEQIKAQQQYVPPKVTVDEALRLAKLASYNILDTPPEIEFDTIVRSVAHICEAPTALVSLVEAERQWFKARCGLDAEQTPRCVSFCAHAIHTPDRLFIVADAHKDRRFRDNPLVTGPPHIRFYAGCPLVSPEGLGLGSLCVIDYKPRVLNETQLNLLRDFGKMVVSQMEARRLVHSLRLEADLSDRLLVNIMPPEVARRLKMEPEARFAEYYQSVTVVFIDLVGFTKFTSDSDPSIVVDFLAHFFGTLDSFIREQPLLCKVKTIGDGYLLAGGLPYHLSADEFLEHNSTFENARRPSVTLSEPAGQVTPSTSLLSEVDRRGASTDYNVRLSMDVPRKASSRSHKAALKCLDFVSWAFDAIDDTNGVFGTSIGIRAGAATGNVIAGVIGVESVAFDIWSDTVNVASRMETNAAPNSFLVTESTFKHIKGEAVDGEFHIEERIVEAKGKGQLKAFQLTRLEDKKKKREEK